MKTDPASRKRTKSRKRLAAKLRKKRTSVLAVIAVIGASIFGFLTYRAHKERAERILRQQRREKRLKKWGYSTKEFDQIMEEHLRSKSQIKKPGLRDRWKK